MNIKRILNQLIILFLVINSLLFIATYYQSINRYKLSAERIENITTYYENRGIKIETPLMHDFNPQPIATLTYIRNSAKARHEITSYLFGSQIAQVKRSADPGSEKLNYTFGSETITFNDNSIEYRNDNVQLSEKLPTLSEAKQMANELINRIGLYSNDMIYDIIETNLGNVWQLEYFPLINGIRTLEDSIQFEITGEGIKQATFSMSNIAIIKNSEREIVPIDLVLFMIEDEVLEQGYTKLSEVSLCYRRDMREEKILVERLIPVYILTFDTPDDVIFVNAFTNQRMI